MASIETNTSILTFNEDEGFLRVFAKPDSTLTIKDAHYDFDQASVLVSHKKVPVLADSRNTPNHDKEVRDFYSSKEMGEKISAMAIIVDSLPGRIIGNFFINISKPHFPTKLFNIEKDAINWVQKFLIK